MLCDYFRYKGGIERLWLSSLDPESVRKALSRIRPGADTVALYHAARARSESDWVVGMSCTRAMTLKSGDPSAGVVSIGRVQTPTVALVVRRDREIEEFKPRDYFEIDARINAATGEMVTLSFAPKDESKRLWTIDKAESLAVFARGKPVVIERNTADKRTAPPALFSLSGLQKRANALWGWSADHTLSIAQSLYETHKATTYPRTDCSFLPAEQLPDVPIIAANLLRLDQFRHLKPTELEPRKTVFNSANITAHHAIIPTKIAPPLSAMTSDERMAYGLIAAHYLGSLLPDYEFQSTKLSTTIKHPTGPVEFSATGITPTRPGWKRAFGETPADEDESTPTLPAIPHGTTGLVTGTDIKAKKTQPPARYTEGTLIEDMRSVAKFVTDPDKKSRLKESDGIGTEATRANILKAIRDRGYVLAKGKQLISTPKGRAMIALLERELPALADPGETAVWDEGLESIVSGHIQPSQFVASIGSRVREYIGVLAKRPTVEPVGRFKMPDGKPTGQKIGTTEILDHGDFFTAAGAITGRVFKDVWKHTLTPAELVRLVAGQTLELHDCRKRDGSPAEPQKIRYNATKKPYPGVEVVRTEAPAVATSVQSPRGKSGILDHGDYYTAPGYESEGRGVLTEIPRLLVLGQLRPKGDDMPSRLPAARLRIGPAGCVHGARRRQHHQRVPLLEDAIEAQIEVLVADRPAPRGEVDRVRRFRGFRRRGAKRGVDGGQSCGGHGGILSCRHRTKFVYHWQPNFTLCQTPATPTSTAPPQAPTRFTTSPSSPAARSGS